MKINSISGNAFGSKVKVIDNFYRNPADCLNNGDASVLKRALRKLEQNERDDTVKVFMLDDDIGIKVETEIKGVRYEGRSIVPTFYKDLKIEDINEAYATAFREAESRQTRAKKGRLDEFV